MKPDVFSLGHIGLALLLFATGLDAQAQEAPALALEQAERASLERENVERLLSGRIDQAHGDLVQSRTWPNPEISLSQESTDLDNTTSRERFFWINQKFDISGERDLRSRAAQSRLDATSYATSVTREQIRARVHKRFFDTLYWQRQLETIEAWHERLAILLKDVRKQEQAGQASQYDVVRLERALETFKSRLSTARTNRNRAWSQLAFLIGRDSDSDNYRGLIGQLKPESPPALESLLQQLADHPHLHKLKAQSRAHTLTARAEGRAVIPDITIGVGRKELSEFGQSHSGNMISLSVNIPLFDRNQGEQARARAAASISKAEFQLTRAELESEIRSRWQEQHDLLQTTRQFQKRNADSTETLLRAAEAGYHGAEVGVLELVDAYEDALDAELRLLELQKQAREAQIDLQTLTRGGMNE